jgi:hypothetical protein
MEKTCKLSGWKFEVTEMERELLKKMGLAEPLFHPKIRSAMRFAFRNERNLFIRKCDFSDERILSIYDESHPFPVYKYDHWVSDKWTPPELKYDFNKPFFEQFETLSKVVPMVSLFSVYNENCDYVNAAEKNKNCYMHILSDRCEDCYYTHAIFTCRDTIDCAYLFDCELCYECVDCRAAYHCRSCFLCDNCSDCNFCFDLRGCSDCFLCFGLKNKKYCINNEQLSEEEYRKKMADINFGSYKLYAYLKKKFIDTILSKKPYVRMINTENSTGNFLLNTKNCQNCYDVEEAEDCMNVSICANKCKDCIDCHAIVDGSELIYSNISTTEGYNCHNMVGCWTTKDSCYSQFLQGCTSCIGCISLRQRRFCVLNKEYSEDEYNKIKANIQNELGEYWGSPFPFSLAPFDYMTSALRDYDSLTREEVEKIGWRYGAEKPIEPGEYADTDTLPDDISDFDEEELDTVFMCKKSGKPLKIVPQEIRLLKKIGAPLPRHYHEVRHEDRTAFRKSSD